MLNVSKILEAMDADPKVHDLIRNNLQSVRENGISPLQLFRWALQTSDTTQIEIADQLYNEIIASKH